MKILFLNENLPCYLADSLFHGLRSLLGNDCVDAPRIDALYSPLLPGVKGKLRGHGFTLYGLLEDNPELVTRRYMWRYELDKYDFVVLAHIWWQGYLLKDLRSRLPAEKIIIVDGEDTSRAFPFKGRTLFPYFGLLGKISEHRYFKREVVDWGSLFGMDKFFGRKPFSPFPIPRYIYPLGFSIPGEKIYHGNMERPQLFPKHIVDAEVRQAIGMDASGYAFTQEDDYYRDLQQSKYGITTKRAGWDCLRHYELAANGCILCFRDLDLKTSSCAPHGLNDENSITYHSASELLEKIEKLPEQRFRELQENTRSWILSHTTEQSARRFLDVIESR